MTDQISILVDELRAEIQNLLGVSTNLEDIATRLESLQPEPGPQPEGEIFYFTPIFGLGAAEEQPGIGTGKIQGWYTIEEFSNGKQVNLELYLEVNGGSPGKGTGGYEIYIPDELEPALDWYVGDANLWISGGGVSEFDGSIKWTFRNPDKGPKLIITTNGAEWSPTHPKNFADLKLRANISYKL